MHLRGLHAQNMNVGLGYSGIRITVEQHFRLYRRIDGGNRSRSRRGRSRGKSRNLDVAYLFIV